MCIRDSPSFNLSPQIVGIITVAIIGFLIFGKQKNLFHAIEFLIPFVGCCYILGGILVITLNYQNIIPSLYLIIKTAFVSTAAFGGIVGAGIAKAFSQGIMKGVFSNEAGTGSAGPVSYTHLDVYKRQALLPANPSQGHKRRGNNLPKSVHVLL